TAYRPGLQTARLDAPLLARAALRDSVPPAARSRLGYGLSEDYDVARRLARSHFVHAVEGATARHHDVRTPQSPRHRIDVAYFDEQPDARKMLQCEIADQRWNILSRALHRLIHDLDSVLRENHEAQLIALRHFDGLRKAEALDPEVQTRLDGVDDHDGAQLAHLTLRHRKSLR